MSEPIRHHYIPQFILKNFCFDNRGRVHYYNKVKDEITVQETRNIFMIQNLYRDEINFPENPTQLERDLGVFENEVSHIIKDKFLNCYEITMSREEDAKLRLFFAIMGFRSNKIKALFEDEIDKETKRMYSHYQRNGDFVDLWKRNLGYIVKCRSIDDVVNHPEIAEPIKIFFLRDTVGLIGMYFVVAERKECEEFILGDSYPVQVTGHHRNGLSLHLYSVFSISPDRIILMVSNGAEGAPREVLDFRQSVLTMPKVSEDSQTYTIRVKRLYDEEVKAINAMIFKEAKEGIIRKTPFYKGLLYRKTKNRK